MLSIAIPSKNERFLDNTIRDVLENATGEIEVFPILDGYDCPRIEDPRVHYIELPPTGEMKKRHGINEMVKRCKGEYVMSLDAHCLVAKGFDEQLAKDHQPNWIQIPRRHRLDAENWCLEPAFERPPIDYEYIMFRPLLQFGCGLHGYKWDQRTIQRMHIPIDETFEFQGSCWFMTKDWFNKMGFMQIEGYTGWGQEAEELSFTTWKNGGKVMTNKNTYYAHLHKGNKYGRMYHMNRTENKQSYDYSYNLWINENKEFFKELINKFMPLPNWPENWEEILWKEKTTS
jgi:glycosyltransferase involved in cell wall biosynthesis